MTPGKARSNARPNQHDPIRGDRAGAAPRPGASNPRRGVVRAIARKASQRRGRAGTRPVILRLAGGGRRAESNPWRSEGSRRFRPGAKGTLATFQALGTPGLRQRIALPPAARVQGQIEGHWSRRATGNRCAGPRGRHKPSSRPANIERTGLGNPGTRNQYKTSRMKAAEPSMKATARNPGLDVNVIWAEANETEPHQIVHGDQIWGY